MNTQMDVNTQLQACYASFQSGDILGAEKQFEQISRAYPNNGDVHHLGALIAEKSGRSGLALQRINLAISAHKTHHEYLNSKGTILKNTHDDRGARKAYNESLKAKPDFLDAALNLGNYLIEVSDPVAAIDVFEKALVYHSQNKRLQTGRAVALKDAMRSAEALAAVEAMDNVSEHAYLRGQILFQLSRHDDAVQTYIGAMKHKLLAPASFKNLLQILWMRGDWQRAKTIIEDVLKVADPALFIAAARVYILVNDLPAAGRVLEQALQKFGRDPYILSERARLKLTRGDYAAGWDDALEALTAKQGDLKIMEDFADCALAAGHHNHAMIAAHAALKIIPNDQYWIAIKYTAGRAMGQNYRYYANYDNFIRSYQLTPPPGYGSLQQYNHVLKQALNEIHEFDQHPLDQSLRSGVQTSLDLRLVDHPVLKAHFKALDEPIRAYMREIGNADPSHPLLRRNTGDYRLSGSWSVKLRKKGFHVSHVHPQGWISSAYYVDVPDEVADTERKAGWIHFGKPPFDVIGQDGKLLGYEKIVQPTVGTLVLFPSYMWHGTNPLEHDATRMTLPIDVVPV